jgi:hypothetical protein
LSGIIIHLSEEKAGGNAYDLDDQDKDKYVLGPRLDILSRIDVVKYMHKALEYAQHQEGITERDLHDIEKIGRPFSRLQIDGRRKQRKVDDYCRPKAD